MLFNIPLHEICIQPQYNALYHNLQQNYIFITRKAIVQTRPLMHNNNYKEKSNTNKETIRIQKQYEYKSNTNTEALQQQKQ